MSHIVHIDLDDANLPPPTPEIEQERKVAIFDLLEENSFALPGRVDNRVAKGCHALLKDGAKLVESPDDILEELGPLVAPATTASGETVHHPGELLLNDLERQVLTQIETDATSIDNIVNASGLPAHQVLSTLSVLEMRRLVRRLSGQFVCRV